MALAPTEAGRALAGNVARSTAVSDPRILGAFERVPREVFTPPAVAGRAYEDTALPIGLGQTISQPSMIALMLRALECGPKHRVLEVGSGCGYVLALLSQLGCEVFGVERLAELAARARETLRSLGLSDVVVQDGDGTLGLPEHAPFDRILVSAGAPAIPEALLAALGENGRLVMPVGGPDSQILVTCERDDKGSLHYRAGPSCVFVPLISTSSSPPPPL
ncbi:MAG TPA: protein-L-isoaspartate(D-aspartate) O-methyltransferase [Polyangiaceae bacterium]|nr:protein-L-isoaspartate(D-aspartate) O-methyltransferase [Polyangiaceae bacterium]